MNILHISPYLPSQETNHAGGICMGRQIETMREQHQVFVLSFIASEFDQALSKKYKYDRRYHFVKLYTWSKAVHALLAPWMPNYFAVRTSIRFSFKLIWCICHYQIDAVHGEYASMAQYQWICRLFPHVRYYMTEHDVTTQSYERKCETTKGLKRWYLQFQIRRLRIYEMRYCRRADAVLTFSEKDKHLLEKQYGLKDVKVLTPFFGIEDQDSSSDGQKQDMVKSDTICFVGQMGREENVRAAKRLIEIGKRLNSEETSKQLYIIGNKPPKEIELLKSADVHVTGFIDDIDEYIMKSWVAVFPLTLGAGIKLKVLRSMALGTPVITSSVGAEGIDEEGKVLILAETDEEFLLKIDQVLKLSNHDYEVLCKRNRAYILDKFNWKKSEKVLEDLYGGKR